MHKLSKYKSIKKYLKGNKNYAGRNNTGRITVSQKGGGHKQLYRQLNFKRNFKKGIVLNFEYDPKRNAFIAKIYNPKLNNNHYILAPTGLKVLDKINCKKHLQSILQVGDTYPLGSIPLGSIIHNIELIPNKGGQIARSAGTFGKIISEYNKDFMVIKLMSGEHRLFLKTCKGTLGAVSNENKRYSIIGKAGRSRWLNKRPTVRGVAMNPIDHPHGGGEGKTSGGRPSVTPWGLCTKGRRTRSVKKKNFLIVKSRHNK